MSIFKVGIGDTVQRDFKFWTGVGLALMSFAPESLGVPDGVRVLLFFLGVGLVITSGVGALMRWMTTAGSEQQSNQVAPGVRVTRTAFEAIQSIDTLPTSLGGNDVLRLGTLAILRRVAPYSLEMVTLLLDASPVRLPDQKNEAIAVEDVTIVKGSHTELVFDTTENRRREIAVAGRTYVVTLLESKRLATPDVGNPIEWVFGITEK